MLGRLLEEDPDLGRALANEEFASASQALRVAIVEIDKGEWSPPRRQPESQSGYLLLEGKILREVRIYRDWNAELLVDGDVLRPWLEDSASFITARWTALERCRLALLDIATIQHLASWPSLLDAFVERTMRRSRSLSAHAAIEALHRVEDRLLLLFWHLAERCGEIEEGRVVVKIRFTHDELSRLVGAQRPTVTTSLRELEKRGKLERRDAGWILTGEPPRHSDVERPGAHAQRG